MLITFITALILLSSCQKLSDPLNPVKKKHASFKDGDSTHSTIDTTNLTQSHNIDLSFITVNSYTPSNLTNLQVYVNGVIDTTISLTETMPHFSDSIDFATLLDTLFVATDSIIYDWITTVGFTACTEDLLNPDVDSISITDFNNWNKAGSIYGSVINKQGAVRIGNKVIVDLFEPGVAYVYDLNTSRDTAIGYRSGDGCSGDYGASRQPLQSGEKYYDANWNPTTFEYWRYSLLALKYNRVYAHIALIYNELGVYSRNCLICAPYSPRVKLHTLKDKYHVVKYKKRGETQYTELWDTVGGRRKGSLLVVRMASRIGFLPKEYCVNRFERTHNWSHDWEEDLHLDW